MVVRFRTLFLTGIVACLSLESAKADIPLEVVTLSGIPVSSLSRQDVADLFLGRRQITLSGQTLKPVDVSDPSLRDNFYSQVAGMTSVMVNAYWARIVFSARGRPPPILSVTQAQAMVVSNVGFVTYLPDKGPLGFKVVVRLAE